MIKLKTVVKEVRPEVVKCFGSVKTLVNDIGSIVSAEDGELLDWLKSDTFNIQKVDALITCLKSVERRDTQRLASFAMLYIDCFLANMKMEEVETRGVVSVELSRIRKKWKDNDFFVGRVQSYDSINLN